MWYQQLCEHKKNTIISWSIFIEELISYHHDVKSNSIITQLINLRKKGPIIEHIQQFQKFILRLDDILDDKLLDLFIGTLEDKIEHEVRLFKPTSLEKDSCSQGRLKVKIWRRLLEALSQTPLKRIMFLLLTHLNLQG